MIFKTALSLLLLASTAPGEEATGLRGLANPGVTTYSADLDKYGSFTLQIAPDGSSMNWQVMLTDEIGNLVAGEVSRVNYHLHTEWTAGADFATESACGSSNTGGHYDPYFGCGGATAATTECAALNRTASDGYSYSCFGAYQDDEFDRCEVGDLSSKYGTLEAARNGAIRATIRGDPLPALNYHFDDDNGTTNGNDPAKFASIVFHDPDSTPNANARVLCGRLYRM